MNIQNVRRTNGFSWVAQAYNTINIKPSTNRLPNPAKHPPAPLFSLLLPISVNIRPNPYEAKLFLIFLFVSFKKKHKSPTKYTNKFNTRPKKARTMHGFVWFVTYILCRRKKVEGRGMVFDFLPHLPHPLS